MEIEKTGADLTPEETERLAAYRRKKADYSGIPLHSSYFFFCIICFNLSDIVLNYYFRQTFVAAYGRK